jgi:hypothetical protein
VNRLSRFAEEARRELGDLLQGFQGAGVRAPGIDNSQDNNP